MEKLIAYLNALDKAQQEAFAARCETTVGYLRKAVSIKQKLSDGLCLRIAAASGGKVPLEELRPDVDWQYLRQALANSAQPAIANVAQGVANAV